MIMDRIPMRAEDKNYAAKIIYKKESETKAYKDAVKEQKEYYRKALPYFTKYRELEPSATDKWAIPLQTIYYQIDMPNELKEVEARMKEKGML